MLLYHGSNTKVCKPDLTKSKRFLDFGMAFYLTANREQAIEFSHKVVARTQKRQEYSGVATVSEYDFDMEKAIKNLNLLMFASADEQWLDYVVGNRLGGEIYETYDLVIGPVANDDVYQVVGYYENGIFTKEMAINALKIKNLFNQYAIKSEGALKFLKYAGYKEYIK